MHMLMSIDDLVDKDFKTYQQLKELKKNFFDQDEIFIVIRRKDQTRLNKAELCTSLKWVNDLADSRSDVKAIVSTFGLMWPTETQTHFKVSPILNINCADRVSSESEAIDQAFMKIMKSPWVGALTAKDGSDIGILIYPSNNSRKKSFFGSFNAKMVDELQADFENSVQKVHPELIGIWVGDGIFQYHLHKGYESMPLLNGLMSLVIVFLFRLLMGSFISSFIFLQLVTWVSLLVYGGMAYFGHPIDVLSSSLSLMFFVSSLEDFVLLSHFMKKWSWRRAFSRVLLPSFFTSLTTMIGFGSLAFADLGIVRRFGIWSAVGALVEWIVLFIFLPALMQSFSKLRIWTNPKKSLDLSQTWLIGFRPKKIFALVSLLVIPFALFSFSHLEVSDSPERLLPPSHPARRGLDMIEQTRGWRSQLSLVFAEHDQTQFNKSVIEKIKADPLVSHSEDVYAVKDFMTSQLSSEMQNWLNSFIEGNAIGHRLGPSGEQTRAILYVKNLDISDIKSLRLKVNALCPKQECWLAGSLVSYGELGERVLSTLYESLGLSLFLVLFILLWLCLALRPEAFWSLALSSIWGPCALLVCFYIFKFRVFYITSMIASIIVGLAGDNAIQFLFYSKRGHQMQKSVSFVGPAVLAISICMMMASSVFFAGYFDPMKNLGGLMILGIFLGYVGDVWILRGLSK